MRHRSQKQRQKEHWLNSAWRPMMGWLYFAVCAMDFIGFPVLWSLLQVYSHGQVTSQWQPITLQGAGLFHLAMGAILGISAYGRTREKIAGMFEEETPIYGPGVGTQYMPPGSNVYNTNQSSPQENSAFPSGPPTPRFPPI